MSRSTGKVPSWASNAQTGIGVADIVTGLAGATSEAQGWLDYGTSTLLTARSNINQRKLEAQQAQFSTLESGYKASRDVESAGQAAQGKMLAESATSGAIVGQDTPQAGLRVVAQQTLLASKDIILNTKNQMKAIKRETDNMNKAEWKDAIKVRDQARKDAKQIIANSRIQAGIKIAKMAVDAASGGATAAVQTPVSGSTASNVAAGMSAADSAHSISQRTKGGGGNTRGGFSTARANTTPVKGKYGDRTALRTGGRHLPPPLPGQDNSYLRGTWRHGIGRSKYGWKPTTARRSGKTFKPY